MASVEFKDYRIRVEKAMDSIAPTVLEEVTGEFESQVKANTVVVSGETMNSWTHTVKSDGSKHIGTVGSKAENSIWEEFGTGDYALNGNGRKGGWFYVDAKGKGHFTHGKHPRRPLHRTYTSLKNWAIRYIQDAFKRGMA